MSNAVTIRPVASDKADDFVAKHVGGLVSPPADSTRLKEIGPLTEHEYTVILFYIL